MISGYGLMHQTQFHPDFGYLTGLILQNYLTGTKLLDIGMQPGEANEPNGGTWGITFDQFQTTFLADPVLKDLFSDVVDMSSAISSFRRKRFERLSSFNESA